MHSAPVRVVIFALFASVALASSPACLQAQSASLELSEPRFELARAPRRDRAVGRVFAEIGMGLLAATIGGTAGGFAGAAIGSFSAQEDFFSGSGLAGGLIGHGVVGFALVPLSVAWAGTWLDGRGELWAAYVGELVGAAAAAGLVGAGLAVGDGALIATSFAGILIFPLLGAIVGYEVSHSGNIRVETEADSVRWMPKIAPTADGQGVMFGARGAF